MGQNHKIVKYGVKNAIKPKLKNLLLLNKRY